MATNPDLATLLARDLERPGEPPTALHGYMLVDGSLRAEIIQQYFLQDESPEYLPLLIDLTEDDLNQSPYLIKITEHSEQYLQWLSHEYPGLAFAFTSPYALNEQLRVWQNLLLVDAGENSRCYFRFYDGSVARCLYLHGSPQEISQVFQLCQQVYFQNEHQYWESFTLNHTPHAQPHLTAPWLKLSEATWTKIIDSGHETCQAILNLWWHHYPEKLHALTHEEIEEQILATQNKFRLYQINHWQQQALFACLLIECEDDFFKRPEISRIFLEEQRKSPEGFGDRTMMRLRNFFTPNL